MNPFRPRNLLLLLAMTVAGLLAAMVLMRYRPPVEVAEIAEVAKVLPSGVDVALQDINYTHTEGGVARWRLAAKQVEHRAADKSMALSDLQVTFFDVKGVELGSLKARDGRVDTDYSVIEVSNEVEVVSRNGYTLTTDHLVYRQKDRSLYTEAPVRLVSTGMQLDGVGMEMDLDARRVVIPARVRAVVQPDQRKKGSS